MNTQVKQRTPEWFEARKGLVTGSRVGAILGVNPYQTRDDVMRSMVREALGADSEFTGNEATAYGESHEGDGITEYEAKTGRFVTATGLHLRPTFSFLGASPDGLVGDDGCIEVKAPYSRKAKLIADQPHYAAQVQLVMACTGRKWCDFVTWTPEETVIERVSINNDWLYFAMPVLQAFHDEFKATIANEAASKAHLEPLVAFRSDYEWLAAANAYATAAEAAKDAEAAEKAARERLIKIAGERSSIGAGVRATRFYRKGNVDYTKLLPAGIDVESARKPGRWEWRIDRV